MCAIDSCVTSFKVVLVVASVIHGKGFRVYKDFPISKIGCVMVFGLSDRSKRVADFCMLWLAKINLDWHWGRARSPDLKFSIPHYLISH